MDARSAATRQLYRELMQTRFAFMPTGEYTLRQVYAAVRVRYEEWCDDAFLCNTICTQGKNQPEWWHAVRRALTQLPKMFGRCAPRSRT